MFEERTDMWEQYAPLLAHAEHPSRYLGQEWGAVTPSEKLEADYHAVMIYPDVYEIGQANQAVAILYDRLNADEHVFCERAYLPWTDLAAAMREAGLPLVSLETYTPLSEFDFVGITLPHELAATNVLETLDLSGIPLHASDRREGDPFVFGGGPCAYNPEPYAPFFDAIFIGEGEEMDLEVALQLRAWRGTGISRKDQLRKLAHIPGVYVPSLYRVYAGPDAPAGAEFELPYDVVEPIAEDIPERVERRIITNFDACDALPRQIVPYSELVHDRLSIEILRGCARGCRFCQAGMIYRPVRERTADTIVSAIAMGLACTGYDEVSLTSLSSTDHSTITDQLRRLNKRFHGTGVGVSIPSQRVDAFGVELARLIAGEKKGGLTLAPEAGTQHLRDVINKGVTEENLFNAVTTAFEAGWRRLKLYFMLGLPGETDEDVAGIGDLCRRVYTAAKDSVPDNQRGNVRMSVSVALFVPKAVTPFQWDGQLDRETLMHRINVLRDNFPRKGVDLHWHDSMTSYIEAVLSRGGRECAELVERAWKHGARFDAWSEQFDFDAWLAAAQETGVDIFQTAMRSYEEEAPLPWDHIDSGVRKSYLRRERAKAHLAQTTPDCTFGPCTGCGVCLDRPVDNELEGARHV